MKITKDLHVSINFTNSKDEDASIYIDYLDKNRFDAASPMLGKLYSKFKAGDLNPDVFVVDWPVMLRDDMHYVNPFIESLFNVSQIISNGNVISLAKEPLKELEANFIDEEVLSMLKGLLLFICALFRYTTAQSLKNVEGLYYTHKDVSEWLTSHGLSSSVSGKGESQQNSLEKI